MKSRIQTVNWKRPAWMGVALLCSFLIGCMGYTHRGPERSPDKGYVRYDTKEMIFEYGIPKDYLKNPDAKARLVFIGPRWKIVRDWEWGATSRCCTPPSLKTFYCEGLFVEELRLLARKGGFGTWKVVLIVKKPGRPPLKLAGKFTLSRRTTAARFSFF